MGEKVRLAILGTGGIAGAHLEGYAALKAAGCEEFEIAALCDNSTERLEAFADKVEAKFGTRPPFFSSAEELAEKSDVAAVDICTPHAFHHTTVVPCLEAGMHVMVEKPCGITIKASDVILEASRKAGKTVAVAEQVRRGIKARAMKWALTEAKLIGDPRILVIEGWSFQDWTEAAASSYAMQWRFLKLLTGGGMIFDAGVHFADMVTYLFGEAVSATGAMTTLQRPIVNSPELGPQPLDVEDTWMAILRFKSGLLCNWSWSFTAKGETVGTQVLWASEGSVRDRGGWMHPFQNGGDITFADGSKKPYEEIEADYRAQLSQADKDRLFPYGVEFDMALECWDFIDSIQKGRRPEIDADDTKRAKALCLAIYESAHAGGSAVSIDDVYSGKVSAYQQPINEYWGI